MDIKKEFGGEVKKKRTYQRKKCGYSQEHFAALVGLSVHGLSDLENGKSNPKLITVIKIAKLLDIDLNQFKDLIEIENDIAG